MCFNLYEFCLASCFGYFLHLGMPRFDVVLLPGGVFGGVLTRVATCGSASC